MRQDLPLGTVTFVFTDIEGSTRLLEELGPMRYGDLLSQHHRVCRAAWAEHGGVEVDTAGDAFFVAFPSASAALAAAGDAQRALADVGLSVRMGVHTGEVTVAETGYVGFEVHRAARVAAAAHGGQVVVSGSAAAAAGFEGLVDLGEHRFKDVDEPLSIFQLGEGSFPPLKTISNTNLPRPASSFVGRERELGEVLGRFERGARLVTLTGPGGSGKTRLALEAAASLVPEFKAGVFWVGLATLRDPPLVMESIAQTLGAKEGLADYIGERELLLLLDNLEQVIDSAPELSALLRACPDLRLLVTSRELLRVDGEVEYAVPPLAEPEAVALFCERAQSEPSDEIPELCARLDNLPLAVELAAARTKVLSPAHILERLSQRLDLFKGGRDADPRQQTLRATIEWSYDLLSDEEQRLFRALSVFAGGCTLDAAEQVADADLDTLQSLVEKSLLRFTNERYWMLETIREFAAELLEASTEGPRLLESHGTWILEVVRGVGSGLRGMDPQAVACVQPESANVDHAIARALEAGAPDVAFELVGRLSVYWLFTGAASVGLARADRLLRAEGGASKAARFSCIVGLSELYGHTGNPGRGIELKEQALKMLDELGDERIPASTANFTKDEAATMILKDLAQLHASLRNFDRARALADAAISRAHLLSDDRYVAHALFARGIVDFQSGQYAEARTLFEQSLPDWRAPVDAAGTHLMIGECLRREQRVDEAIPQLRTGFELALTARDVSVLHEVFQEFAAVALIRGKLETAAALLGCSERLREELELPIWDPEDYKRTAAALAHRLGEARFGEGLANGAALSDDEAYDLARSVD
jgi:predicted ATPase